MDLPRSPGRETSLTRNEELKQHFKDRHAWLPEADELSGVVALLWRVNPLAARPQLEGEARQNEGPLREDK